MSSDLSGESLSSFLDETGLALETMSAKLLCAEQGQLHGDGIHEIFRAAHSVKGLAGFFGLTRVQKLTHGLETLLDRVRQGKRQLDQPAIDLALQAVDDLGALLKSLQAGRGEEKDIAPTLERLEAMTHEGQSVAEGSEAEAALGPLPEWLKNKLSDDDALEILIASKQADVHALKIEWHSLLQDPREPIELFHALESRSRILATFPVNEGAASAFAPLGMFAGSVAVILTCAHSISDMLSQTDFPACTYWKLCGQTLPQPLNHRLEKNRIRVTGHSLEIKPGMEKHLQAFLSESREELEALDTELIAYEANPQDRDRLAAVFRLMHRLKSSTAAMGLQSMSAAAHHSESLLAQYRQSGQRPGEQAFKALFTAKDFLCHCLERLHQGEFSPVPTEELENQLTEALSQSAQPAKAALPSAWEPLLASPQAKGLQVFETWVTLAPATPLADLRYAMVWRSVSALGEIIASDPSLEALENGIDDPGTLHLLVATTADEGAVHHALNLDRVMRVEITPLAKRIRTDSPKPASSGTAGSEIPESGKETKAGTPQAAANTVRVDAARLDTLLNIAGELTVAKARVAQLTERIGQSLQAAGRVARSLESHSAEGSDPIKDAGDALNCMREAMLTLNRHIVALQSGVMQARMVPVGPLFQRFHRLIRDLCKDNGKKARLIPLGEATELDKKLIDELADPITHLVRNAVDHGLELPDERSRAGKPEQGTIKLEAFHDGGQVCIRLSDDGRGLDVERIRAKAVRMGIITEAAAARLSESETHQLIFQPGFSTAAQVTNVSGRGVGMDIVRAKVQELKGQIDITSQPGNGCTFTIRLPLTLAMLDGLLVQVGGTRAFIPVEAVQEIVDVQKESRIRTAAGGTLFALRNQVIALHKLKDLLGIQKAGPAVARSGQETSDSEVCRALVLKTSGEPLAIEVDHVYGREETVIKPLTPEFDHVQGLTGATVLGDGSIALIVDAAALRKLAMLQNVPEMPKVTIPKEIHA